MRFIFFILLVLTFSTEVSAQYFKKIKPYTVMIGGMWNIIDDDGHRYAHILNVSDTWNLMPYPTSLNVDVYFQKGMSLDMIASYNTYDSTKTINGSKGRVGQVFSLDAHFKYSFGFLMRQQWFDPFIFIGGGYTGREVMNPQSMLSANVGGGFNIMFWRGFGLQWRTTGKVSMVPEIYSENYDLLQHHFGLIYKVPEQKQRGRSNNFHKRKYKWGHKNYRYRKPKGM